MKETGCFLYRGEEEQAGILAPAPDLLLPETYGSEEAARFFQCLDDRLEARKGHIGTATRGDAAAWGTPVTVWPLGDEFHYVWPKRQQLFYPSKVSCTDLELVVDANLEEALRSGKEVLFSSSFGLLRQSAFLVVPPGQEESILDLL